MNLERPINTSGLTDATRPAPRDRFDDGEHGAGIGLSGGFDQPRTTSDGFNAGLGGSHASAGIPKDTPIADKFMSTGTFKPQHDQETVSGAYVGSGTTDALTGKSDAHSRDVGFDTARSAGIDTTTRGAGIDTTSRSAFDSAQYGTGVGAVGGAGGHYRREDDFNTDSAAASDPSRGAPISDPKDLDTGGPHSLVFQEETGQYVHRRDL